MKRTRRESPLRSVLAGGAPPPPVALAPAPPLHDQDGAGFKRHVIDWSARLSVIAKRNDQERAEELQRARLSTLNKQKKRSRDLPALRDPKLHQEPHYRLPKGLLLWDEFDPTGETPELGCWPRLRPIDCKVIGYLLTKHRKEDGSIGLTLPQWAEDPECGVRRDALRAAIARLSGEVEYEGTDGSTFRLRLVEEHKKVRARNGRVIVKWRFTARFWALLRIPSVYGAHGGDRYVRLWRGLFRSRLWAESSGSVLKLFPFLDWFCRAGMYPDAAPGAQVSKRRWELVSGVSARSVDRALLDLEAAGLVRSTPTPGGRTAYAYTAAMDLGGRRFELQGDDWKLQGPPALPAGDLQVSTERASWSADVDQEEPADVVAPNAGDAWAYYWRVHRRHVQRSHGALWQSVYRRDVAAGRRIPKPRKPPP